MKELLQKASYYRKNAHAPFSNFFVGAALLSQDGTIIGGCNVESHVYGLTICAERNAIFTALAQGHKNFQALAIAAQAGTTPCGACRQIIVELCGNIPIFMYDSQKKIIKMQAYDLLPNHFQLQKNLINTQESHNEQKAL